jgi:lipoprotein-anchoring transpeptidase ErfK/SrfK
MGRVRTRLRYRRLGAAGGSCAVTLVAVLGGIGVLPADQATRPAAQATLASADDAQPQRRPARTRVAVSDDARFRGSESVRAALAAEAEELPADSGEGRRVVFDMSAQRVWLVGGAGAVRRTYPVSGSVTDNLDAGTYEVYSRSEQAWGIDDSGSMKFMVRFAQGDRAAIGFHDIPVKDGELVQTRSDLGTPQSHGCIRQWRPDAKALWAFAPVGTTVVVVP